MLKNNLEKSLENLSLDELETLLEEEKNLVLQEQIEIPNIMPKPPIQKELWKYGAIQFGYISFFLLSFPAAAIVGVILNVIHINLLYYGFTTHIQRKDSVERSNIGVWNTIFFIMSFIALISNMGILVFGSDGFREFVADALDRDFDSYTIVIILVIIEHIGFIFKFVISTALKGTPAWVRRIVNRRKNKKLKDQEKIKKKYALNKVKNVKKPSVIEKKENIVAKLFKENAKLCNDNDPTIEDKKESPLNLSNDITNNLDLNSPNELSPKNNDDSEDSIFNSNLKGAKKDFKNKKSAFVKNKNQSIKPKANVDDKQIVFKEFLN